LIGKEILAMMRVIAVLGFLMTFVSGAVAVPISYQNTILADNPLLYYQLNEQTGPAVNYGSLGSSYNGDYNSGITRGVATIGGDTGITFNGLRSIREELHRRP
jgi:hypothetical protein